VSALDEAIERPSVRAEVLRRIRAAIIYGDIEPGKIHSAPAFAARMGVSITPVREALLELTNRGMVTQVRNRGFRVVERSPADLDAALELRSLLEAPMTARLAGHLEPEEAATFRALVDDGLAAAHADDLSAFLDIDRRFHLGLLRRAGNPRVVDVVDQILDQLRLATFSGHGALVRVAEGHGEILDAIVAGDAGAVERAIEDHFELTRTAWHPTAGEASGTSGGGYTPRRARL
jgi:DNA-binding GntR family transcriptional regulator